MDASSEALLCDLYELTMAEGYWRAGVAKKEAVFHLFFRKTPFGSPFAIACGLAPAIDFIRNLSFKESDLKFLATLRGSDGSPVFSEDFLNELGSWRFACDVDAIPEGTPIFPHEPMVRVQGPVFQAQILESALLNIINFQTLIATKAARVCLAAKNDKVIEFGLRRAQGPDGGLSASRASFVGGCHGSSNALAGLKFGMPVSGTQAHSWIMFFDDETEAFDAYAAALPNNCVFLVDTYNSLEGVRHAVEVAHRLRNRGREMIGVRLDSGDIADLSRKSRKLLDQNGFPEALIVASGDLDEWSITSYKERGAQVDVWGVGSKLVSGWPDGFLGGVYKLSAAQSPQGLWKYRLKLSEDIEKITPPGILQVRRCWDDAEMFSKDIVFDVRLGLSPTEPARKGEDLLVPIFRRGEPVYTPPSLIQTRQRTLDQLRRLPPRFKELRSPPQYRAEMDPALEAIRTKLVERQRQRAHIL